MQKRRLYKLKTYDGKIKEVEWYQLPANRKEQIYTVKLHSKAF